MKTIKSYYDWDETCNVCPEEETSCCCLCMAAILGHLRLSGSALHTALTRLQVYVYGYFSFLSVKAVSMSLYSQTVL